MLLPLLNSIPRCLVCVHARHSCNTLTHTFTCRHAGWQASLQERYDATKGSTKQSYDDWARSARTTFDEGARAGGSWWDAFADRVACTWDAAKCRVQETLGMTAAVSCLSKPALPAAIQPRRRGRCCSCRCRPNPASGAEVGAPARGGAVTADDACPWVVWFLVPSAACPPLPLQDAGQTAEAVRKEAHGKVGTAPGSAPVPHALLLACSCSL